MELVVGIYDRCYHCTLSGELKIWKFIQLDFKESIALRRLKMHFFWPPHSFDGTFFSTHNTDAI